MEQDEDDGNGDSNMGRPGSSGTSRRAMKWAVDVQMATTRPACCKLCAAILATDDLRLSTWGSRKFSRWCCTGCLAGAIPDAAEFAAVGQATAEHAEAARRATVENPRLASAFADPEAPSQEDSAPSRAPSWDNNALPNRAWWAELSWKEVHTLGASTFVQVPERFRGAFSEARRKALEVLAEARQTEESGAEWKCFLVLELLLLGHPRGEGTCAELLEERLAWFWGGQWSALWASARNCRKTPASTTQQSSDKQRAARVQTLGASGEEARALQAATSSKLAPRTQNTLDKTRECFPTARPSSSQSGGRERQEPSAELQEQVAAQAFRLLRKHPKLSAPGLLGTRLEHLSLSVDDPWVQEELARTVAALALGLVPPEVLQGLRVGEVVSFDKGGGEVRPLLVGSSYRRLGLKALMAVKKDRVAEAVGKHQYGVGRKGGVEVLVKLLEAQAEVRPTAAFLKVDVKAAFQRVSRDVAFREMEAHDPELAEVLRTWYTGAVEHLWRDAAGHFQTVLSNQGFDQGCPLSGAGFSVAQRGALDNFLAELQVLDPLAKLYSYLDDTYLVVDRALAAQALEALGRALAPLGLDLNPWKTLVWCPAGTATLPVELAPHATAALPVLGSYLRCHGDLGETPHNLGQSGTSLDDATLRLSTLSNTLGRLRKAGLKRQAAAALLRSYAGSASQHALRLTLATAEQAQRYDEQLARSWGELAERPLDDTALALLGLPAKLGGVGAHYAKDRRCAAFFAAGSAAVAALKEDLGCSTVADALDKLPLTAQKLDEARQGLAGQGVRLAEGATLANALQHPAPQSLLMLSVQKNKRAALLQPLPLQQQAEVRGAGGPGSTGFLNFPSEPACSVEDTDWATALRQRLHYKRAECSQAELSTASTTCQLKTAAGVTCGEQLDEHGYHSCTCQAGGGVVRRHGRTCKGVGSLVARWTSAQPLFEQRVPAWDRQSRSRQPGRDPVERAILDLEYQAEDGRIWLDISVRHPAAGSTSELAAAARRDGEAARRGEREKHARYPGDRLVPFVLECGGRLGGEARQWLRSHVAQLPEDTRQQELTRAHKVVSCALQGQVARQLRKAAGLH